MLEINGLYKEHKRTTLNHITLSLQPGELVSLNCSNEHADLLFNLILGKELPAKGEITIAGQSNSAYSAQHRSRLGVIFRDEGFYERVSVLEYISLFRELVGSAANCQDVLLRLALLDLAQVPVRELTYSQRKRLSFAREILKSPVLLLFQEPVLNMDRDDVRVVMENIEELRSSGTAILCTSVSYKETLLLGGKAYHVESAGTAEIHPERHEHEAPRESGIDAKPSFAIAKIPARLEDRILLFDPVEIDYIESEQSVSYLHIRGDKFVSTLSLNDLEERLKHFGFFRSHRAYLVNLQRVREVVTWTRNSYSLSLDDKGKTTIPLSKGRLDDLKAILSL